MYIKTCISYMWHSNISILYTCIMVYRMYDILYFLQLCANDYKCLSLSKSSKMLLQILKIIHHRIFIDFHVFTICVIYTCFLFFLFWRKFNIEILYFRSLISVRYLLVSFSSIVSKRIHHSIFTVFSGLLIYAICNCFILFSF